MSAKIQRTEKPPLPVATAQPGTMIALTLNDCEVTAFAGETINSPSTSAAKGCTDPSAQLRRHRKDALMAVLV